jgi:ATP-binding cassette, subfamily B, multidrug efflux pump
MSLSQASPESAVGRTRIGADLILVMKDGRIVERGSHAELVAPRGAYHALVNAQLEE